MRPVGNVEVNAVDRGDRAEPLDEAAQIEARVSGPAPDYPYLEVADQPLGGVSASAFATAAARPLTPSFAKVLARCFWTVRGLMKMASAISGLVIPAATSASAVSANLARFWREKTKHD